MKNSRYILIVLFLTFVLVACAGSDTGTTEVPTGASEGVIADQEGADEGAAMAEEEMADDETAGEEMAGEAMAEEEMVGEEMADAEMTDDEMTDEAMVEEETAGEAMVEEETAGEEMTDDEMAGDEMAMETERPAWQHLSLTNARSGETFTLADFAGKTVFVEPMATWCTNCRQQLGNVRQAREQLDGEDVVFVALSVETNIGDGDLSQYAEAAGFDWVFAVMTPEMLQQLVDAFGRAIGNPPSTPHFVIRPDGTTTELVTGIDPPEQVLALVQAAQ